MRSIEYPVFVRNTSCLFQCDRHLLILTLQDKGPGKNAETYASQELLNPKSKIGITQHCLLTLASSVLDFADNFAYLGKDLSDFYKQANRTFCGKY